MKPEVFEARAAEMRQRMAAKTSKVVPLRSEPKPAERKYSIGEAADILGISYSTALRLFRNEAGVPQYSTRSGRQNVYPDTPLKRFEQVRMTYVIPESVLRRVQNSLCGSLAA
jgi:hypothetical protein